MLYTVKDTAKILKTNVNYVYNLIRTGLLPAIKVGSWKIRDEALEDFLRTYEGYDISDVNSVRRIQPLTDN